MEDRRLAHLKSWSRLLDESIAIPGTKLRFGLDPLLDVIPVLGDLLGLAASAYILIAAQQMGVSRPTLARMAFNLVIDAVAGAVPGIGILFDAGWKANVRNVALIERHGLDRRAGQADFWFLLALVAGLAFVVAATTYASVMILVWLWHRT